MDDTIRYDCSCLCRPNSCFCTLWLWRNSSSHSRIIDHSPILYICCHTRIICRMLNWEYNQWCNFTRHYFWQSSDFNCCLLYLFITKTTSFMGSFATYHRKYNYYSFDSILCLWRKAPNSNHDVHNRSRRTSILWCIRSNIASCITET